MYMATKSPLSSVEYSTCFSVSIHKGYINKILLQLRHIQSIWIHKNRHRLDPKVKNCMFVTILYYTKAVMYQRESAHGPQIPQLLFITIQQLHFFCPLQIYNYSILVKYFGVVHPHLVEYFLNIWYVEENGKIYCPKVSFGSFAKRRFNEWRKCPSFGHRSYPEASPASLIKFLLWKLSLI